MTIEKILKLRQEAGGLNKLMHMHVVTLDEHGGATVELELTEGMQVVVPQTSSSSSSDMMIMPGGGDMGGGGAPGGGMGGGGPM